MTDTVSEWICLGRHAEPVGTAEGSYLCPGCQKALEAGLESLARYWSDAMELEGPSWSQRRGGSRRGPGSSAPTNLDLVAMADRRSTYVPGSTPPVARWIYEAAVRVARERKFQLPPDVMGQIGLLWGSRHWLAHQDWVDRLLRRLAIATGALRRITGEVRHVIDRCTAPDADGAECGGPLLQDRDGRAAVTCARCGETWSEGGVLEAYGELRRLGLILRSGERANTTEEDE